MTIARMHHPLARSTLVTLIASGVDRLHSARRRVAEPWQGYEHNVEFSWARTWLRSRTNTPAPSSFRPGVFIATRANGRNCWARSRPTGRSLSHGLAARFPSSSHNAGRASRPDSAPHTTLFRPWYAVAG